MATVLYADVLFAVNFSMDFLSLAATASLLGRRKRPAKIALASALGALYGVTFAIANLNGAVSVVSAILSAAAMCVISFGYNGWRSLLNSVILMAGCGALLGGIMTALLSQGVSMPIGSIIISGLILSFFIIRAVKMKKGAESVDIIITYKNKTASFSALCDSGNLMKEPFGGTPVIIVSKDVLNSLLNASVITSLMRWDGDVPDGMIIRPVPGYSCGEKYITAAFRADKVSVKSNTKELDADCFIAISPHPRGYFGGYDGTVPTVLVP